MEVIRARKKPIIINAFKFDYNTAKKVIMPNIQCAQINGILFPYISVRNMFIMNTLEGVHEVSDGDWIITGVNGEHYPCKPDIFKKTYDIL